jgi:hypothetical protein
MPKNLSIKGYFGHFGGYLEGGFMNGPFELIFQFFRQPNVDSN